jgi:hypothetical protein
VAWFVRKPSHLKLIAATLVFAAMFCSAQQIVQFILSGSKGIRDVSLPTQGIPMGVMVLILYRNHRISFGPKRLYPFIIAPMLFAIMVSFTRSIWMMMILSYAYGMWFQRSKRRSNNLLLRLGGLIAIVFLAVILFSRLSSGGFNIQKMAENRVQTLAQGNDYATEIRIVTSISAWNEFVKSPIWGYGLGYPIYVYDLATQSVIEDMMLHNSPLYYGLKVGSIGLIGLVWLIIAGARNASRVASEMSEEDSAEKREIRAFAQSILVSMIPFIFIGPWSGNLNYFPFMMPLGLFIGLNWEKLLANAG